MKLDRSWIVIACTIFAMWIPSQQALAYELRAWGYDGTPQTVTNLPSGSDFIAIAAA